PALVRACAARGIAATTGARYPARGRENLVQLFTSRHRADPRPLVRRIAELGAQADAVQLELGAPLRWPGDWRRRLVEACVTTVPALLRPEAHPTSEPPPPVSMKTKGRRQTLELFGGEASGLVAADRDGARLLLFPPDGTLVLFTGERTGGEPPGRVRGLAVGPDEGRTVRGRVAGPLLPFSHSPPFPPPP